MESPLVVLGVLILMSLSETAPPVLSPEVKKHKFSLEEIIPLRPALFPDLPSVEWISGSEYLYTQAHGAVIRYNADTDASTTYIDADEMNRLHNYTMLEFSKNGQYRLLGRNMRKVYRRSSIGEYFVYNLDDRSIKPIAEGPIQAVVWGGRSTPALAYVQDNNVFYMPNIGNTQMVAQLTTHGVPGDVYYGVADWVYEEEILNAAEAMWFSPNGSFIAVAEFNDTNVESAVFPFYGDSSDLNYQYPEMVQFKYPKAGRTNPTVGLRVYRLFGLKHEPWSIPAPVDVVGVDHILGRVSWATDSNLIVLWLNRRQSVSVLVNCDLELNKCNIAKEQNEEDGWIDISEPYFDSTGNHMYELQPMHHNEDRYTHATRFDFTTLEITDLSPGRYTVTEVVGWNDELKTVYYIKAPEEAPWRRELWLSTDEHAECVSCMEKCCHAASAVFSPNAKYGIITCSASNVAPSVYLYRTMNKNMKLITDNHRLKEKLDRYEFPTVKFEKAGLRFVQAHIKLLLPPDFDEDTKWKYPLIVKVYSGPGTSRAKDSFDTEYYNTYLSTNRSMVVASIDVRGSRIMSVQNMHSLLRSLGTVEISDTLEAIEWLLKKHPALDPDRVGVWGWSYGGFASTMMLMQDYNHTLACAAAVAPVTSWLYYDTMYTERYMDLPQANPLGYRRSDLMRLAERLRNRKYLLVHGTGDDNVHYQHSLQLAKQLQHADIEFEQMSYTDENHSLFSVSLHFYHTLDRFWTQCFKGDH